jgi:hypothetical protein
MTAPTTVGPPRGREVFFQVEEQSTRDVPYLVGTSPGLGVLQGKAAVHNPEQLVFEVRV